MPKFWRFTPHFLLDEPGVDRLGEYCRFLNDEELVSTRLVAREPAPSNFPTARLQITLETFSADCFYWPAYTPEKGQQVFTLVSQNLREAMALNPQGVQYLPVDTSLSAPVPHSKNYMIMRVLVAESVSDPDRSEYEIENRAGYPNKIISPTRIVIRQDMNPAHELFYDRLFSGYLFCTDKLAIRVLQSGCTGVRFFDPDYLDYPMRFRSRRGIEEETWDAEHGKPRTRLLQAIPWARALRPNSGAAKKDTDGPATPVQTGSEPEQGRTSLQRRKIVSGPRRAPRMQLVETNMNTDNPSRDYNGIYEEYANHIGRAQPANWPNLKRLTDGSLEFGPSQIITASALLLALDRTGERDAVASAIAKFKLIPTQAADVLAARAYVWAKTIASWDFDEPPQSGDSLEAMYEAITLLELARPGTVYRALQGDEQSIVYLNAAAQDGLSDEAFLERRILFANAPIALQTTRTSACAALELQPNND